MKILDLFSFYTYTQDMREATLQVYEHLKMPWTSWISSYFSPVNPRGLTTPGVVICPTPCRWIWSFCPQNLFYMAPTNRQLVPSPTGSFCANLVWWVMTGHWPVPDLLPTYQYHAILSTSQNLLVTQFPSDLSAICLVLPWFFDLLTPWSIKEE